MCRDFGVSRKTGCKIFDRYKEGAGRAGRSVATPGVGYVVLPLRGVTYVSGAGHLICWRATADDDEHYVYAIGLCHWVSGYRHCGDLVSQSRTIGVEFGSP